MLNGEMRATWCCEGDSAGADSDNLKYYTDASSTRVVCNRHASGRRVGADLLSLPLSSRVQRFSKEPMFDPAMYTVSPPAVVSALPPVVADPTRTPVTADGTWVMVFVDAALV